MDIYASAFYDTQSNRYPNKFMVVQTEGGVSMDRLHDILQEASDRFFPKLEYGEDLVLHPNERHGEIETVKADFGAAAVVQGTFQEVPA